MGAPPHLTLEERRAALAKAAHSRKLRAEFKAQVKAGEKHWLEAFSSETDAIRKMRVKELLQSLPGIGEVRAMSLLERAGISHSRRIQGVGKSQYESLLRILKEDA